MDPFFWTIRCFINPEPGTSINKLMGSKMEMIIFFSNSSLRTFGTKMFDPNWGKNQDPKHCN